MYKQLRNKSKKLDAMIKIQDKIDAGQHVSEDQRSKVVNLRNLSDSFNMWMEVAALYKKLEITEVKA